VPQWCNGVTTIRLSAWELFAVLYVHTGANRFYIKFLLTREYTSFLPDKYVSNRTPTGWTLVNRSVTIRDGRLVSSSSSSPRWRTTEFPDWAKINPLPLRRRRTPPPRVSTTPGVLRVHGWIQKQVLIWSRSGVTNFIRLVRIDLWVLVRCRAIDLDLLGFNNNENKFSLLTFLVKKTKKNRKAVASDMLARSSAAWLSWCVVLLSPPPSLFQWSRPWQQS